jgi:hypothetical protein
MSKRPKMSKSKGNVVTPDEVVHGVHDLASNFEFRDIQGRSLDDFRDQQGLSVNWKDWGVWRSPEGYRMSTRCGRRPVFLHLVGEPVPPLVRGKMQHPEEQAYWANLLELYEDVEPVTTC